jgi:uncharacterized protein (TIGR02186 family)
LIAGSAKRALLSWLMVLVPAVALGDPGGQEAVALEVVPQNIRVGLLYNGTEVRVAAGIPRSDGVIITIEGDKGDVVLNKKGKLGLIWLNVAQVTAKNAPRVYLLAASGRLADICSPEDLERLGLGLEALRGRISFESRKPLAGSEFDEFLKLKKHSGTYNAGRSVDLHQAAGGRQEASAALTMPAAAPPGEYKVRLYCFSQRMITAEATASLSIEEVGAPLLMTRLAHRYGAAYGVLAIVIGMGAGIVMGLVFGSRRGGGH